MGMKFTKVPTDTFQRIQLNAGILLSDFTVDTGSFSNSDIIGATSGGTSFEATPNFVDFGEDIDNVPKNTKELKKIDDYDVRMSGTFVTMNTTAAQMMVGAADVASEKVSPRSVIDVTNDFDDIWWVGDYSNVNEDKTATGTGGTDGTAGFIAIKLIDAMSTGGFKLQTGDKAKGQFAFEFTGHYSISDEDLTPPFEIYVHQGTAPVAGT